MPILAVDSMGRIYETSPDREDGQGIKEYPSSCDQQDNTLGNAYLKDQARRRDLVMRERLSQEFEAQKAKMHQMALRQQKMGAMVRERMEQAAMNDPRIKQNQIRRALSMGCKCEHEVGVMGNVMSANGQKGYKGMSRDQQTLHHALNPSAFPKNTAFGVDPVEQKQFAERVKAFGLLGRRSRGMSK
jgi:hypothetical protein